MIAQIRLRLVGIQLRILLIGVGAVGAVIATHLVDNSEVSHVILGDVDIERTRFLTEKLGSTKASAMQVDAGNREDLMKAMKKIDVVVNATVPRFNLSIMDAALQSKVHYIDLERYTF